MQHEKLGSLLREKLETINEEHLDISDDEGFAVGPTLTQINVSERAFFFNIQALFQQSDTTLTPVQFLDNAKNNELKWTSKEDNKLLKAFQRYENNWHRIQDEMKTTKMSAEECKNRMDKLQNSAKGTWTA